MKFIDRTWKASKRCFLNANFLKKNVITSNKNNTHWLQNILKTQQQ